MAEKMGLVHIRVGITNKDSGTFTYYTGLVDTGTTRPILPSKIAEELGIEKGPTTDVMTGNGLVTMYDGVANFEIEGMQTYSQIWISDHMDKVIIGLIALESVGLAVDSKKGTLKKKEFLFYNIASK